MTKKHKHVVYGNALIIGHFLNNFLKDCEMTKIKKVPAVAPKTTKTKEKTWKQKTVAGATAFLTAVSPVVATKALVGCGGDDNGTEHVEDGHLRLFYENVTVIIDESVKDSFGPGEISMLEDYFKWLHDFEVYSPYFAAKNKFEIYLKPLTDGNEFQIVNDREVIIDSSSAYPNVLIAIAQNAMDHVMIDFPLNKSKQEIEAEESYELTDE